MVFHDLTISVGGQILAWQEYDSSALESSSVALFGRMLRRGGLSFRNRIPHGPLGHIELSWQQADRAAIATFLVDGIPATASALLSGNSFTDPLALLMLQELLESFGGTLSEDVLSISARPVSISVSVNTTPELPTIVVLERLLAAAFFAPRTTLH